MTRSPQRAPWPPGRPPPVAPPSVELGRVVDAALLADAPEGALRALARSGVLAGALPELTALQGLVPPAGAHHKDIWEHTLQVVAQSPARRVVRWAALLHDIGKVATRSVGDDGEVCFAGHAEQGARLVSAAVAPRLGFAPALRDPVVLLVRHHQRAAAYDSTWSDSAVRRLGRAAGPHMDDLLALAQADVTSAVQERRTAAHARVQELGARWRAIWAADARPSPLPRGLGHALMQAFALEPGPQVGRLRRQLLEAVAQGRLPAGASIEACVAFLRQHTGASP